MRIFIFYILLALACSACNQQEKKEAAVRKPNILLIVADDLGYSDIGSFGKDSNDLPMEKIAENIKHNVKEIIS